MSGLQARERERATNPLDVLEQIISSNEWVFERRSDGEMAAEAPGKWCDYGLFFSWSPEISAMHFSCAFDMKVPPETRHKLFELLAIANEKLWIGHFGLESEDGVPVFRHSVLLRGAPGAAPNRSRTWSTSPSPNASGSSRPSSSCCGAARRLGTRCRRRCSTAWGRRRPHHG